MTWGLSMALHEESVLDPRFGDYVNHDFAEYHIATNADVGEIDVTWIEEDDPHVNPIGVKGIGEIGIVGTAAAIANAIQRHACADSRTNRIGELRQRCVGRCVFRHDAWQHRRGISIN
jgi:CO/xanthine dehydrogenase Mo-binding subunit